MLLWDTSHARTTPWYPFTWAQFLIRDDGTFGPMAVLHTFSNSTPVFSNGRTSPMDQDWNPEQLIIATRGGVEQGWNRSPPIDCDLVDMAVPAARQLICTGAGISVRAVPRNPQPSSNLTDGRIESLVEEQVRSYGESQAREARLAAAVSVGTAAAGTATSLGISYSMGLVAANSGELGMAVLSGMLLTPWTAILTECLC